MTQTMKCMLHLLNQPFLQRKKKVDFAIGGEPIFDIKQIFLLCERIHIDHSHSFKHLETFICTLPHEPAALLAELMKNVNKNSNQQQKTERMHASNRSRNRS